MRQQILQDRHVTYRDIETSLGISGTSKYIQYCMNIWLPRNFVRWTPHNLLIVQKKAYVDRLKEMLQKYDRGASKHVYDIVTDDEPWIYAYEP